MSESKNQKAGAVGWIDLTVADAEQIRDFYIEVVGWRGEPVDMDGYSDFIMKNAAGEGTAGVCHARGINADLPPQWLIYITVEDLDKSLSRCIELGGKVKVGPKGMGAMGRYCVIEDPAGAVAALFEPSS